MNAKTEVQQDRAKANGKWATMSDALKEGEKQAKQMSDTAGEKVADTAETLQSRAADLVESGGKIAQSTGSKIVKFAKDYPVQTALAGLAVTWFFGRRFFAGRDN
jgi:hypothetical protein